MNRDAIIRMAREAGLWPAVTDTFPNELERFAALVAAAEREKVAKWMIQRSYATGHGDTIEDLLAELDWQIAENWNRAMIKGIETEREATIEDARTIGGEAGVEMEKLIRARGTND